MKSARFELTLLVAGQLNKELFHNEALQALEMLVQPIVSSVEVSAAPDQVVPGLIYRIAANATGEWKEHAGGLALMTSGGWRYARPFESMRAVEADSGMPAEYRDGSWSIGIVRSAGVEIANQRVVGPQVDAIGKPEGGAMVDQEARAAVGAVIDALREHGLIAP